MTIYVTTTKRMIYQLIKPFILQKVLEPIDDVACYLLVI